MVIVIIVIVIALVGAIYLCYKTMDELTTLQCRHDDLCGKYDTLQQKYNAIKKDKDISYWLSLLRNPNRGKIIIAKVEIHSECYGAVQGISTIATMYGDGRIFGSYSVDSMDSYWRNKSRKINREPHTLEEVKLFFEYDADWLWAYYEFYRDFVKGREHPVSKIQTQKEIKTHVGKNLDNEVTALLHRLSKGACIYLSSAVVLETVKHKGKKCLEISGLEGEYRQEVLYRGGKWIDINGKEHILVEKNTALVSVIKYLLDKLKVLNIHDTPVREL